MQTFLPYADFGRCASVLDDRRLGKQRVEVLQIFRALTRPDYAWKSHPAVLMWKGFEEALVAYGLAVCREWVGRGFADTVAATITEEADVVLGIRHVRGQAELTASGELPPWLGDEELHRSHQSSLVGKDPLFYAPRFPSVPPDLPYVWPVRSEAVMARERARAERARLREARAAAGSQTDGQPAGAT
jgi:hypothetical protein